ncbi:MAG: hypothetical protein AAFO94_08255 [Bacteroidota bacterium]
MKSILLCCSFLLVAVLPTLAQQLEEVDFSDALTDLEFVALHQEGAIHLRKHRNSIYMPALSRLFPKENVHYELYFEHEGRYYSLAEGHLPYPFSFDPSHEGKYYLLVTGRDCRALVRFTAERVEATELLGCVN